MYSKSKLPWHEIRFTNMSGEISIFIVFCCSGNRLSLVVGIEACWFVSGVDLAQAIKERPVNKMIATFCLIIFKNYRVANFAQILRWFSHFKRNIRLLTKSKLEQLSKLILKALIKLKIIKKVTYTRALLFWIDRLHHGYDFATKLFKHIISIGEYAWFK